MVISIILHFNYPFLYVNDNSNPLMEKLVQIYTQMKNER